MWTGDIRKLHLQRVNNVARFVEAERGLREISHAVRIGNLQSLNFRSTGNNLGHIWSFAQCALDFIVITVTDQDEGISLFRELDGLDMNLGDERARGVNHLEPTSFAAITNSRRNAVCAVNHALPVWNVIDLMNEDRALFCQFIDNVPIVNNLAAHIDGRAEGLKGNVDDVNRAHHASTESTRLQQQHPLLAGGISVGIKV